MASRRAQDRRQGVPGSRDDDPLVGASRARAGRAGGLGHGGNAHAGGRAGAGPDEDAVGSENAADAGPQTSETGCQGPVRDRRGPSPMRTPGPAKSHATPGRRRFVVPVAGRPGVSCDRRWACRCPGAGSRPESSPSCPEIFRGRDEPPGPSSRPALEDSGMPAAKKPVCVHGPSGASGRRTSCPPWATVPMNPWGGSAAAKSYLRGEKGERRVSPSAPASARPSRRRPRPARAPSPPPPPASASMPRGPDPPWSGAVSRVPPRRAGPPVPASAAARPRPVAPPLRRIGLDATRRRPAPRRASTRVRPRSPGPPVPGRSAAGPRAAPAPGPGGRPASLPVGPRPSAGRLHAARTFNNSYLHRA
jgi:hypothetical protein